MIWFGNQHIFELGWRRVYIAASCNLIIYQDKRQSEAVSISHRLSK